MTIALGITDLCLLLLGAAVGAMAVRAVRVRHWLGGTLRGLVALLLLALAALAATVTVGLQGYRALTFEEVAATVRTEPLAPQRFRATITLPDHRLAMYDLARRRSEEHTSELQSRPHLVCRLLLEKKKKTDVNALLEQTRRPHQI